MIQTGFDSRVKIQQVIDSQLPEFILDESPKAAEFLKQYYISQEYQGGPVDIAENLDQYLKLDNLIPEVIVGSTTLSSPINSSDTQITVDSTKGFPSTYGLLKIDNEIITYTGIDNNTFTGCIRGFSGITTYSAGITTSNTTNYVGELLFSESESASHADNSLVANLSSLFLKEFYKKLKYTLSPGLENLDFVSDLNIGNFIRESRTLYEAKGTEESFRILFNILFGETPKVINLENNLIKPSSATYVRRVVVVAEKISGNPLKLEGQTIKKSTDENTTASVSEVEIIQRSEKTYYKLLLFIGFDDAFPTITGQFNITGSTKNIETVNVSDSVITVDSTIGFPNSGKLYSGDNEITYTSKSINQFFGCTGVTTEIETASTIRSDETYYGYENGDTTKKVEFRLTGVITKFVPTLQSSSIDEGENISIKHLGEVIENPAGNSSYKEIFANSWTYNTSSRYQIDSFPSGSTSQFTLKGTIDKSSLKVGDTIEILNRSTEIVISSNLVITQINNNQIVTNGTFTLNSSFDYDIRRKLEFASSSIVPLEFNKITSNIQNVYVEYDGHDEYAYVAANSLPSYEIQKNIFSYQASSVSGQNVDTEKYSIINFIDKVSFYSGSEIYYSTSDSPIEGLAEGLYYVEVINDKRQIRLYRSRSFIGTANYIEFGPLTGGTHTFVLNDQKANLISAQKILRKFPLSVNIADGKSDLTPVGSIGILINGVEISGYKTNDKIYYGPLETVGVLNGGTGFDVINPPLVLPLTGNALLQPTIKGSFERIYVNPQDFDIDVIVSVAVTGGNGRGASFEPVIETRIRQLEFDAKEVQLGGGVDTSTETITFLNPHGLVDGQSIIYNPVNNPSLGIGTFNYAGFDPNLGQTLTKGATYYTKYISDTTIQLYQKLSDYRSGINTVGFTTIGTSGIHKFETEPKKTLTEIKVINPGENYENKKLIVKPIGISTVNSTVSFKNHGFSDGELVTYTYETSGISGLSTSNQYYILKVDNNTFKLVNAGIGGTNPADYNRGKFVQFDSTGSGYQIFNYPEISLSVEYSTPGLNTTQSRGTIVATPVVRGSIAGIYVYENGSDYGSSILNLHKKPKIVIKNGKSAELKPVIVNGIIKDVNIQYGGSEYYSTPSIIVKGDGTGAIIKPIIVDNKLSDVVIINGGIGYTKNNTSITVEPAGKNAILNPNVRSITVNKNLLYGEENDTREIANELLISTNSNLEYVVCGYSENIQNEFDDDGTLHSPIIGWAYDGNPIYGSYGYSNPDDINSPISRLSSGYTLNTNNIQNRPNSFENGFFIEDYKFTNTGDLDEYNGRFCVTPEFPNGVYAYFATSVEDAFGNLIGQFPYFVGERYRAKFVGENISLNQSFDFNNSNLIRNTLPYKVNELYAGNDFIIESNEVINQLTLIDSVTSGSVENYEIIESGDNYKVGDSLEFNQESGNGSGGLSAQVSEITGKEIVDINASVSSYNDATFTWKNGNQVNVSISPYHTLNNLDYVTISGFSTSLSSLNGFTQIGVSSFTSSLLKDIPSYSVAGVVTDIYVARIPENISIGSTVKIDNEILSVINVYGNDNVLRVVREATGAAHTATSIVNYLPNTFTINQSVFYFESKVNNTQYFNPKQSVGVGTTSGIGISINYIVGTRTVPISVPTQSIYLPEHQFTTNQQVILRKLSSSSAISVANTESSTSFNLPISGDSQIVYVIKKSNDHIGIVTQIGLTTTTNGLFFRNNGSDDYRYSIESNFTQIKGDIDSIKSTVSISTSHGLKSSDIINLTVNPNLSVGIGTSTSIKVKYDSIREKLIVNPLEFGSSGINTITNEIIVSNHSLNTGDKVVYSSSGSVASGLTTGIYYVYKVDRNTIKLCETIIDSRSNPPTVVNIESAPIATHNLGPINPSLNIVKNNNVLFDLSDTSLSGYNFKLFYDNDFKDEFVSTGTSNSFSVAGVGTIGISSTASLTLSYNDDIPFNLFYNLEKSGYISTADTEINNYCQILFADSVYTNSYSISGVGTTTFEISLQYLPENLHYSKSDCDILKYTTNSINASGGVSKIRTISPGIGFKKVPIFKGINSTNGEGAYLIAKSNTIGNINQTKILNEGFEYPSDKTLRPTASIASLLTVKNSNTIFNIQVSDGGKNYTRTPDLIIANSQTGEKINSGALTANLFGTGIISVNIDDEPKGLPATPVNIRSINNSNGIGIQTISTSSSGIVTCYLVTPLTGFQTEPFALGDKIFVEGIQKYTSDGDGFNSENYGYTFFTITGYENASTLLTRKLEYNLSGLSTNVGLAKTIQESYGYIINYNNYPKFEVSQKHSPFIIGEQISIQNETGFELQDLKIVQDNENYVKVFGKYEILPGQVIRGVQSGNLATVETVNKTEGYFNIGYGSTQNIGWSDDIGKINEDTQVIPDNDYYQNLSYSVKSNQEWVNIVTPVNSILHPTGLKNFADTTLTQSVGVGTTTVDGSTQSYYDITSENRVDTINNFDLVVDVDTLGATSKYLKFKNRRLADYIECRTNRVLAIDDISGEFSNSDANPQTYSNLVKIIPSNKYNRYLIQITNSDYSEIQFTEIIIINNDSDIYALEKSSISNLENQIADISGYVDENNDLYLRFVPYNPYDKDYNIKILNNTFSDFSSGIGTQSIGFIDLIGSSASIPVGITTSLIVKDTDEIESLHSSIHILNTNTNEMNYVELYVNHDGTDTNISEFYFDSNSETSSNFIGSFGASISSGVLTLNYTNTSTDNVIIRSKNIGFNTTGAGIGTYRFKKTGQLDGYERTVNYISDYSNVSTASTIISLDISKFSSLKSTIRVSIGNTSALHQIMMITDSSNAYTVQYPFLSIGSTSGIGSFGSDISGLTASLIFYPDQEFSGNFEILSFSEQFYTVIDKINIPPDLEYANIIESVEVKNYYGINNPSIDRLNFDLYYQEYPIFMKEFDPSDENILNLSTGEFTILNHFFSTGERLIYRPKSTFLGIGETSVGIGLTLNSVGVVTDRLPFDVYAYKINNDKFKLSTRKDYALAGICVTFTSVGEGNAHQLEMYKKNEKSIISIDNIIQYPIAYSLINHTINNYSNVSTSSTIFALSGISSIFLNDLLKIDDEYVKVTNVGFGTTVSGPITFTGTVPLVEVERGFVGSSATSHIDLSSVDVYRGSFNIEKNQIFFTQPPIGSLEDQILQDNNNLPESRSKFNGRVFLKKDYTSNRVYDNISETFTGVDQTYTLTVGGGNTVGLGTSGGNGIVLINGIFQTPTTQNNPNNNFRILENINLGISSITFSGITSTNGSIVISESDVNLNQLPRGGVIVSLGSTPGLGYAPLVGASVTAIVGAGGSIVSIGIGTTGYWGSGYRNPVSVAITETGHTGSVAVITASVGVGGSLAFNIIGGGNGYSNPIINVSSPNYENLPITGVSRLGVGTTTSTGYGLLLNVEVGASSTVGVGSTLFEVTGFKITRPGYGFKKGDVFTPVGLVTAGGIPSPVSQFELTVLDTFSDSFGAWQFGELDYIDPIKNYQDGSRTRFPLYYNSQLLSFEASSTNLDSQLIDFDALLVIFINGILQEPKYAYQFSGGTSFTFTQAPKPEDNVSIFFYRGSSDDSSYQNITETIKIGDQLQVYSNNGLLGVTTTQNPRTVSDISSSDKVQTNIYTEQGIDTNNFKPTSWTKQKVDKVIDGSIISKSRDSIEPQIYPTAKIIKDVSESDTSIYVDNAQFFNYENVLAGEIDFDALIVSGSADPVSAAVTAIVSIAGTIQSLTINDAGSGYVGSAVTVKIAPPPSIGVGVGSVATATISIVSGSLSVPTIINPGFGYTTSIIPQVIVPLPNPTYENINTVSTVQGFSGNITGISTGTGSTGISTSLSIKFTLDPSLAPFTNLTVGQPIYIFNTKVGNGVTSIDVSGTTIDPDSINIDSGSFVRVSVSNSGTGIGPSGGFNIGRHIRFGFAGGSGNRRFDLVSLDTTQYTSIVITAIKGSGTNGGEDPDFGENLQLQYSINGGSSFTTIGDIIVETDTSFNNLNSVSITIPSVARTNNTIFRFNQVNSSGSFADNYGITDIFLLSDNGIIGVGTTFLDNIYFVDEFSSSSGIITCNVMPTSSLVGIATTGSSVGQFSWGKLSGFTRSSSPISIDLSGYQVDSGLSTFPTIQRRGYGLRDIGPIKKLF